MESAFYEEDSRLLKYDAFAFVLNAELKRAIRSQNYVTLVLVEASRERDGVLIAADESTVRELAQIFAKEIRDTDLIGHFEDGTLGVALWDADFDHSTTVIDRLVSRVENYDFQRALWIAVGAACCPTHAVDLESLRRQAGARPVIGWRAGTRPLAKRTDMTTMKRRGIVQCLVAAAVAVVTAPMPAAQEASPPAPGASRASNSSAPPPTKAPPPIGAPAFDYRIGHGDKLRIEVYKDQQLSQSVQVRPDGRITMPLIGDLTAVDQTPIQLRDTIAKALKEYVTNPTVTVIVVEATGAAAYVMGEVNRPGMVTLQGGPLTVIQALALAGGLKDFADVKSIRILRRTSTGVQTIPFNYKDAIRGSDPVYLQTGDTVVVPD